MNDSEAWSDWYYAVVDDVNSSAKNPRAYAICDAAKAQGISFDEARAKRIAGSVMGRDGTQDEFGAACAFLCSTQAAFITGQNLLLDGGGVNATL